MLRRNAWVRLIFNARLTSINVSQLDWCSPWCQRSSRARMNITYRKPARLLLRSTSAESFKNFRKFAANAGDESLFDPNFNLVCTAFYDSPFAKWNSKQLESEDKNDARLRRHRIQWQLGARLKFPPEKLRQNKLFVLTDFSWKQNYFREIKLLSCNLQRFWIQFEFCSISSSHGIEAIKEVKWKKNANHSRTRNVTINHAAREIESLIKAMWGAMRRLNALRKETKKVDSISDDWN